MEQPTRDDVLAVLTQMGVAELADVEEVRRALHPEFECWSGAAREPLSAGEYIGFINDLRAAFADYAYEVPAPPLVEGNRAATTYRLTGTHTGVYQGVPATGRRIDVGGVSMFELEGGRVRRMWTSFDSLAFVTQLGLFPPSGLGQTTDQGEIDAEMADSPRPHEQPE